MNNSKITFFFSIFLILSIWMCSCSENPYVGEWTGSQGEYNYTLKIKKDKTFFLTQHYPRYDRVYSYEGKWKEFNDDTIELSYNSMTISSSKNEVWQLDSNAKEYPVEAGRLFLRKDGSFGDSMLKVIEGSFYLTKNPRK